MMELPFFEQNTFVFETEDRLETVQLADIMQQPICPLCDCPTPPYEEGVENIPID